VSSGYRPHYSLLTTHYPQYRTHRRLNQS
jgi:hypothetical protein